MILEETWSKWADSGNRREIIRYTFLHIYLIREGSKWFRNGRKCDFE